MIGSEKYFFLLLGLGFGFGLGCAAAAACAVGGLFENGFCGLGDTAGREVACGAKGLSGFCVG